MIKEELKSNAFTQRSILEKTIQVFEVMPLGSFTKKLAVDGLKFDWKSIMNIEHYHVDVNKILKGEEYL